MSDYLHDNPPAPFNPQFRPGFREAVSVEYDQFCEDNPESTQEDRIQAHQDICERLENKFPTVGDTR